MLSWVILRSKWTRIGPRLRGYRSVKASKIRGAVQLGHKYLDQAALHTRQRAQLDGAVKDLQWVGYTGQPGFTRKRGL